MHETVPATLPLVTASFSLGLRSNRLPSTGLCVGSQLNAPMVFRADDVGVLTLQEPLEHLVCERLGFCRGIGLDLTANMAMTSLTSVGNSADSLGPCHMSAT